ncbi:ABC transporter ATP-binding protein [Acuticoccus kandeliae]|uniref:ABC transporter ATP-binding protein n=1 Tax=Acuticoccus kandeliae TaxID=2073160 RepID=UPI000D3EAD63|nr:ABC transporter ATP-binding protein [Acuticoccus kandeliae]
MTELVPPASGGAAKLVTQGLEMRFGLLVALEPTDITVAVGEFLTLLGPSGSGKSTLLQLVCGLLEPAGGTVLIDGKDQTGVPVYQRDIGLVFQHYALFPHLTVGENVAFPLKMRGIAGAEAKAKVKAALEMVHLGHLGHRFPRELSGGQQQRVALARCFVYEPSIILMDEPLGALDKKLRDEMQIEIKRLHRETGATIIYVTHDQEEALAMSDRICVMNHAKVEQIGTPHEIYSRPRTEFAANFIGLSNIFRGERSDGRLVTPHGAFTVPADAPGTGAAIVVRPEQLTLGEACENRVCGTVREVVYAGSETRIITRLDAGGAAGGEGADEFILRLLPGSPIPTLGERISASWNPDIATMVP